MKAYIYQGQILTYAQAITHVAVSTTYPSNDHVALSDEQMAFYEANPTTSVDEVWNMQLAPAWVDTRTMAEIREQAYASEPIIEWNEKLRTCDECRDLLSTYEITEQTDKYNQLRTLWLAARTDIQTRYADV